MSELDRRSRNGAATAVFCVRTALDHSGHGISLESVLYPEHYVVHASGQHVEINAGEACGCAPGGFPLAASFVVEAAAGERGVRLICKDDPRRRLCQHGCFVGALPEAAGQAAGADRFVVHPAGSGAEPGAEASGERTVGEFWAKPSRALALADSPTALPPPRGTPRSGRWHLSSGI